MRSGRLRHSVTIKKSGEAQNDYGSVSAELVEVKPIRCNVQTISGVELIKSGLAVTDKVISVMARYDGEIKEDMFMSWDGDDYAITVIKPDDKKRQMVISGLAERR